MAKTLVATRVLATTLVLPLLENLEKGSGWIQSEHGSIET